MGQVSLQGKQPDSENQGGLVSKWDLTCTEFKEILQTVAIFQLLGKLSQVGTLYGYVMTGIVGWCVHRGIGASPSPVPTLGSSPHQVSAGCATQVPADLFSVLGVSLVLSPWLLGERLSRLTLRIRKIPFPPNTSQVWRLRLWLAFVGRIPVLTFPDVNRFCVSG